MRDVPSIEELERQYPDSDGWEGLANLWRELSNEYEDNARRWRKSAEEWRFLAFLGLALSFGMVLTNILTAVTR